MVNASRLRVVEYNKCCYMCVTKNNRKWVAKLCSIVCQELRDGGYWLAILEKKINEMMTALRHLHDTSEDFGPG